MRISKPGKWRRPAKYSADLKDQVAENLRSRATLAALGNSLDFFKNPEQALADIPDLFRNGFSFYSDHIDQP